MTSTEWAVLLRRRAAHLRTLATAIEAMPAMSLDHHAGDDTWRGSRPQLCRTLLASNQHQLHGEVDRLRSHAYRLESQADQLEASTGLAG